MKKRVIGYIFYERNLTKDEKTFLKIAKRKNIELVLFNLSKDTDDEEIKEKAKRCDIIFNNSAEQYAIEMAKTFEALGKKVIESSQAYYYLEDKWMFFVRCDKNKIPVPKTILLSEELPLAIRELEKFNSWPVVLKRVEGTCGEYVKRAKNISECKKIINLFWKKGSERLPIVAQEYIESPCYRITIIDGKVVQAVMKNANGWKKTGVHEKLSKRFVPDKELIKIIKKIKNTFNLSIFGLDLLKKYGSWKVLEINSEPAFDFIERDREKLIEKVLDFLKNKA